VGSSRPEAPASSPSSTPRPRQMKFRAASSLGPPWPASDRLGQPRPIGRRALAGCPGQPWFPHSTEPCGGSKPSSTEKATAKSRPSVPVPSSFDSVPVPPSSRATSDPTLHRTVQPPGRQRPLIVAATCGLAGSSAQRFHHGTSMVMEGGGGSRLCVRSTRADGSSIRGETSTRTRAFAPPEFGEENVFSTPLH
jgi:hypothetical protein